MHTDAMTHERVGYLICSPASMSAGAEKAKFIPEYKNACPVCERSGIAKYILPLPVNKTNDKTKGTSAVFNAPTPFNPRNKNPTTIKSPTMDGSGA